VEPSEIFLKSFLTLFVVVDPIGVAVLFLGLAGSRPPAEQRRIALRAVVVATGVLLAFALFGAALLSHLGITMDAFRVAGGLLLLKIAVDMVFAQVERETAEEAAEARTRQDISVFPLAIPLLAGPGALASVMIASGTADVVSRGAVLASIGAIAISAWLSLLVAGQLFGLLGTTGVNVVTRILGILLAALAIQYVADGARGLAFLRG
jgi:multiple antibiotic resistance protein